MGPAKREESRSGACSYGDITQTSPSSSRFGQSAGLAGISSSRTFTEAKCPLAVGIIGIWRPRHAVYVERSRSILRNSLAAAERLMPAPTAASIRRSSDGCAFWHCYPGNAQSGWDGRRMEGSYSCGQFLSFSILHCGSQAGSQRRFIFFRTNPTRLRSMVVEWHHASRWSPPKLFSTCKPQAERSPFSVPQPPPFGRV